MKLFNGTDSGNWLHNQNDNLVFTDVSIGNYGPDSSVGIATGYGLDGPGIEFGGFGGLGVSMLASGTQDRGFAPERSRRIFSAGKIHSMPSFGRGSK
jgi:hypothetical protein